MMLHPLILVIAAAPIKFSQLAERSHDCLVKAERVIDARQSLIHRSSLSRDGWLGISGPDSGGMVWNPLDVNSKRVTLEYGVWVRAIAFGASHKTIYGGDYEGNVFRWNPAMSKKEILLCDKGKAVNFLFVSSDERLLVFSAAPHQVVRFWDLTGNKEAFRLAFPSGENLRALAISPVNKQVVIGIHEKLIALDTTSYREQWTKPCQRNGRFEFAAFSPTGDTLIVGEQDGQGATIHLLNPADGKAVCKSIASRVGKVSPPSDKEAPFPRAQICPRGLLIAWAFDDPEFQLWEVATMRKAYSLPGKRGRFHRMMFISTTQLVTTSLDGELCIWDLTRAPAFKQFRENTAMRKESAWDALLSLEPLYGVAATDYFRANPKEFLTVVQKEPLVPIPPPSQRIESLIQELDSESYSTREKAAANLIGYGELIEHSLLEARHKKRSLDA